MKKNKSKKPKYPYLPLSKIKKYEKLAEERNLSLVSRGKKKSTKSDKGFLEVYKVAKGSSRKLAFIPAKKSNPAGNDYDSLREKFLNARLGQMKKAKTKLFKDGVPTNQHLVLIMNGYSPASSKI